MNRWLKGAYGTDDLELYPLSLTLQSKKQLAAARTVVWALRPSSMFRAIYKTQNAEQWRASIIGENGFGEVGRYWDMAATYSDWGRHHPVNIDPLLIPSKDHTIPLLFHFDGAAFANGFEQ